MQPANSKLKGPSENQSPDMKKEIFNNNIHYYTVL